MLGSLPLSQPFGCQAFDFGQIKIRLLGFRYSRLSRRLLSSRLDRYSAKIRIAMAAAIVGFEKSSVVGKLAGERDDGQTQRFSDRCFVFVRCRGILDAFSVEIYSLAAVRSWSPLVISYSNGFRCVIGSILVIFNVVDVVIAPAANCVFRKRRESE
jgi:hypothetical protein